MWRKQGKVTTMFMMLILENYVLFLIWEDYRRSAIHYRPPLFYPYLLLHQTQVEQCATQHTYTTTASTSIELRQTRSHIQ